MDLVIGIAIGAAFAPFWMMVYNNVVKPAASALIAKIKTPHPPEPPTGQ